jgi:hypothetical protein
MNDSSLADRIGQQITTAAGAERAGRSETATIETLPARLGCSPEVVEILLAEGVLAPERPVHDGQPGGPLIFSSDALNAVKRLILSEVAAGALDGADGDPEALATTAAQAVARHQNEFGRKPKVTTLARPDREKDPSTIAKVGKVAGILAGGAALAGGASYLRGRSIGAAGAGFRGALGVAKAGAGQLATDARRGLGWARNGLVKAAPAAAAGIAEVAPDAIGRLRKAMASR